MITMKYDGHSGVREHIMKMSDMASQLKGMDMTISEEEERLKVEKPDMAHLTIGQIKIFQERFTESGQHLSAFALFLREHGIIANYTMPGTPEQNGVAERRNRTLIDMVVPKTPYELWVGRKPNLNYLHVWGCPAEAKIFNPQIKKLDSKTISCNFIGYPERSKEVSLRRSQREKKPAISNDYKVYLNECDYDVGLESDPTSYDQAINSENSTLWLYAMEEELKSMKDNEVWDL
ncbi:Retrovirus-related Pol polyprotein from transposon TNT 1-94 [Vitis vinifera]|uniref:Retrovirus-related Pol polyprotein from transposon TNT 1-94 n=1 Tax=Vitis vinifera TaxID=29760 RepID=A0A438HDY9_VITVI|nr:Retrovirus-related Pol polyprotein from transposon TNT 1-94 [Vitis vinifera]